MKKSRFAKLFDPYLSEPVSEEEKKISSEWEKMHLHRSEDFVFPDGQDLQAVEKEMLQQIHRKIDPNKLIQLIQNPGVKIAASVLIVLSVALILFYNSKRETSLITVTAAKGEITRLLLPDGSKIWLNAGGVLRYPKSFNKGNREVYLINGEAFFDVKHDEKSIFTVHNGKFHVKVLGTAFNVKSFKDLNDIRVTVMRGKVEVGTDNKSFAMLTPNKEILLNKAKQSHSVRKVNAQKVGGWKSREINLYDVSFQDLIETIQNTYDVQISYPHKEMDEMTTTIHFSAKESLPQVLEIVKMIHGLKYTINGKEVLLEKVID